MLWESTPVGRDELPALAGFLGEIFQSPAVTGRELLDWKYFVPRADWSSPRSWAIRNGGHIAAHAGIWPLRLRMPDGRAVDCAHVIDWAASPAAPGAGAEVYRATLSRTKAVIAIGSSGMGRKTLRKLGVSIAGEVDLWAKPARPWSQFRCRAGAPLWKNAAKLARNSWWASSRRAATSWSAQPVDEFPASLKPLLREAPSGVIALDRNLSGLNYTLQCPAVDRCAAFLLVEGSSLRGHALLSRVGPQTRIADIHALGPDRVWIDAYAAAVDAAAADPDTLEITAYASTDFIRRALDVNGFRRILTKPLWLGDPYGFFAGGLPFNIHQIASDAFFLGGDNPFLT
jgi:hypothetical protein